MYWYLVTFNYSQYEAQFNFEIKNMDKMESIQEYMANEIKTNE